MNKAKVPLIIFSILSLCVSFVSYFFAFFSSLALGGYGKLNIGATLEWFASVLPVILILIYAIGFFRKPSGKILLIIIVALQLFNIFDGTIENVGVLLKMESYETFRLFLGTLGIIRNIFGMAVFIILLLYLLKVIKAKIPVTILTFVYIITTAIKGVFGTVINLFFNQFIYNIDVFNAYFIGSAFLSIITAIFYLVTWLIFAKSALLKD